MADQGTIESASLDDAIQGAFDAGSDSSEIESDYEPTIEDDLISTLRGDDEGFSQEPDLSSDTDDELGGAPVDGELFTVRVDGEELQVSLDELLGGYQRQADYTRKTQTLAEQRAQLAAYERFDQALQTNPEAAIRALAETLGLQFGTPTPPVNDDVDEYVDPLAVKIQELEGTINQLTSQQQAEQQRYMEAQRLAAVDAELESVRQQSNDPNFDEAAVLQFALDNQIGNLGIAYKAMRAVEAESAAKAEQQRIVESKRNLPPVEGGRARSAGSTRTGASSKMSFEQALEAALQDS